jgi:hypothetical protein
MTPSDLRVCALQVEESLLETGDPFSGDDWSAMQVVRAYLAEHPADDDEPITAKWLESCGFRLSWSTTKTTKLDNYNQSLGDDVTQSFIEVTISSDRSKIDFYGIDNHELGVMKPLVTRGEFKMMAKIVGIEWKELTK